MNHLFTQPNGPAPDRALVAIKPALLALAGLLIAARTGVVATLVWQSYGDTPRRTIAQLSPQLDWLAQPLRPSRRLSLVRCSPFLAISSERYRTVSPWRGRAQASDIARLQAAKQDSLGPDIVTRASQQPPAR